MDIGIDLLIDGNVWYLMILSVSNDVTKPAVILSIVNTTNADLIIIIDDCYSNSMLVLSILLLSGILISIIDRIIIDIIIIVA